jgi:hypothetical protein
MAFERKGLKTLVEGSPRILSYITDDTATTVSKRYYFQDIRDNLAFGDWIFVTTSTGGVILHVDEIDPLELGSPR